MSINKTTVKKALTLASVPNDQDTDDYKEMANDSPV